MKYRAIKDNNKRLLVLKYEKQRLVLKVLSTNKDITFIYRWKSQLKLRDLQKNTCSVRLKNRCVETSRSHSVFKKYKLSRIKLREYILFGNLPGLKKSSW